MLDLIINVDPKGEDPSATRLGLAIARRHAAFVIGLHAGPACGCSATPSVPAWRDAEERATPTWADWWRHLCAQVGVYGRGELICGLYAPAPARRSRIVGLVVTTWPGTPAKRQSA